MAIQVADGFSYSGSKPLDARLKYDTVANMKAVADASMYDGCLAYCVATDKTYQWKSTNTVDDTLGKWREFSSGGGGASSLSDLSDTNISSPTDGQLLKYDAESGKWINGSGGSATVAELGDIQDVNLSSIADGQIIKWDAATSKWVNANLPTVPTKTSDLTNDSGFITQNDIPSIPSKTSDLQNDSGFITQNDIPSIPDDLNDLSDVDVSSPSNGQVLKYNGTSGKWENGAGGSGGASALNDLSDVGLSNPSSGQVLRFDGTDWENSNDYRELTAAQYATLSQAEKMNGTTYYITDGEGGGSYSAQSATLAVGATTVSFTVPTTGNYLLDVYTSDGRNYTGVDTSVSGTVTLTFNAPESAVTVYLVTKEV